MYSLPNLDLTLIFKDTNLVTLSKFNIFELSIFSLSAIVKENDKVSFGISAADFHDLDPNMKHIAASFII